MTNIETEILIFERVDEEIGELWESIKFKLWTFVQNGNTMSQKIKCDFRMPTCGAIRFNSHDDKSIIYSYELPNLKIPNFIPGGIDQNNYTLDLKKKWDEMPNEQILSIGKFDIVLKKDIIDGLECTNLGELYIYRPNEVRFNF